MNTSVDWTDGGRRPPITHIDDYQRGTLTDEGSITRPHIDGEPVTVDEYEAFRKEWAAFYDASRCAEPNCDGEAEHAGPHFAWTAE